MDCGLGLDSGSLLVDDDLELGVGLAPDLALSIDFARRDLAVEVLPLNVDVVNSGRRLRRRYSHGRAGMCLLGHGVLKQLSG